MSKATVTRLFIGSVIAVVAGAILAIAARLARDRERRVRDERLRHRRASRAGALAWSLLGLGIVGGLADRGRADRRPRVVDRRPAEHLAAREQDVVRRSCSCSGSSTSGSSR